MSASPATLEFGPMANPSPVSQEELDRDPIGGAINAYLTYRDGIDTMQDNYALLETLPNSTDSREKDQKPALTICMPIAITREDESTITRALDAIAAAQQKFGRPIDIILWTNAKYATDRSNEETVSMDALLRYESLRSTLAKRQDGGLRIRTALQTGPEDEMTIGQIRTSYMEAVALDAQRQELGYDHPVMWFDADLIDVSDKTFGQVVEKVQAFEGLFVHPMTHYGIDWADGKPLSETDAATKAVAIDEIRRRQKHRSEVALMADGLDSDAFNERYRYVEENGLAFAIGTYLIGGGLPVGTQTDETLTLTPSVMRRYEQARQYYAEEHEMELRDVPPSIGLLPERMANRLTRVPQRVVYLPGSYTTMSAREQYSRVKAAGPKALRDMWSGNYAGMYIEKPHFDRNLSDTQIARDLRDHVNREVQHAGNHATSEQKARVGKLVSRYFDDTDESRPKP